MQWRRKKSLVSPKEQIFFGLELVVTAIGFNLLVFFFLYMSPMSEWFGESDETHLHLILQTVYAKWPLVMLSMVILTFIGVLMSHRLYGPLFGMRSVIQQWLSGNTSGRLRLRKFDYLLPIMAPMNQLLDRQARLIKLAQELAHLTQQSADAKTKEKASELLEALK